MSKENTSAIWNSEDVQNHISKFGRTGKGKSTMLMQLAKAEGIPYEEMEDRLKPSQEQEAAWENERQAEEQKAAKRLQCVRDAYWDNSPTSDFDSNRSLFRCRANSRATKSGLQSASRNHCWCWGSVGV